MFLFSPLAHGYLSVLVIFLIYWAASIMLCGAIANESDWGTYVKPAVTTQFASGVAIALFLTAVELGYLDDFKPTLGI